jgi:hypothetical protein
MGGLRSPVQNEVADFIGVISDGEFVSLPSSTLATRPFDTTEFSQCWARFR